MPDPKTSESVLPDAQCRFLLTGFVSCRDDPLVRSCTRRGSLVVRNRQGKEAIPNELWSAAIALACANGVNRTAAGLHLDGGKLKRLMVAAKAAPKKCAQATFVELTAPQASLDECMIELEGRRGKIRIQ